MTSLGRSLPAKGMFMPSANNSDSGANGQSNKYISRKPTFAHSAMPKGTATAPQTITLSSYVPPEAAFTSNELAASMPSAVPKSGRRRESIGAQMRKQFTESPALAAGGSLNFQRSMGQTLVPLFGRSEGTANDAPGLSMSLGAAGEGAMARRERRDSTSSGASDDDGKSVSSGQAIHRCEACNKIYRHPNCLVKHRWEHTTHWKEASRFSMSKHQQVQLLEAAAILVGMDAEAHSLPEEKALWPAAVSPAASGLLGSDKINFELLRKQRMASRKSNSPAVERRNVPRGYSSEARSSSAFTPSTSLPVPAHAHSSSLSPLNTFSMLNIGRARSGTFNNDVASLRLDESAERSMRPDAEQDSDDEDEDDDDEGFNEGNDSMTGSTSISAGSPAQDDSVAASDKHADVSRGTHRSRMSGERYGLAAGGDVMAEMDMEMDTDDLAV